MEIISGKTEFNIPFETAVAIGKFDGIHLGHRALLSDIVSRKEKGLKALVFTFCPSAAAFFGGGDVIEIMSDEKKRKIFEQLGIDYLLEFPLNEATAEIPAEKFLKDILSTQLKMKYIACGSDVSFGYKGLGDRTMLLKYADTYGYEVNIIDKLYYENDEISSTLIRKAIRENNAALVKRLLGE